MTLPNRAPSARHTEIEGSGTNTTTALHGKGAAETVWTPLTTRPCLLSHPQLTGMPRERLHRLVAELAEAHEARREYDRHNRRGADRRRARGAGPRPKLDAPDRILATVLYLRKLCTQAILGELFAVDKGTIGRAVQEISPLLDRHGYTIKPSTARFPSPNDLAAYLATGEPEAKTEIKPAR